MNIVLILAGGVGSRVGADRPKQFVKVLGKPVLAYTCDIFQQNARIDKIVIICHSNWIDYCQHMVQSYNLDKVKSIVPGGETFQDSVIQGIRYLQSLLANNEITLDENIFIHYGAAPFTSQKIINSVIQMTKARGSAVTGTPCYQLLGTKDTDTESKSYVNRDNYIQIACPYGFRFGYLLDIYDQAKKQGLLDIIEPHTTSLMYALGNTVNYTYGDQSNIKITTKEDIDMFEGYVMRLQRKNF